MDILYRGHRVEYTPPEAPTVDEVLVGQFRGHPFYMKAQKKVSPLRTRYRMQYRGH